MNRRSVILTAASLVLLAALAFGYRWFSGEPVLIVHLRCEADVSGKLSVVKVSPKSSASSNKENAEETFDVANVCQTGKIAIEGYRREEAIEFTFVGENAATNKVVAEYGLDIQSDQNEFYTVLKIKKDFPFIIKDGI